MHPLATLKASLTLPSPLTLFTPSWKGASDVTIWVKRDDAIHPVMSGNKWRKLSNALREPLPRRIASFGGGFSNHLHALGYACHQLAIPFTAIIRGNYSASPSPMIKDLLMWNSNIEYVDKATYKKRNDQLYLRDLRERLDNAVIIPEGGSQHDALLGIKQMVQEISTSFDILMTPVASGATLAGIANALNQKQRALGVGVLKGEGYLESLVSQFIDKDRENWSITHDFHLGGYAKTPAQLRAFCDSFNELMPFKIEPVYSGKVFWALKDMLENGRFEKGTRIVVLHTGGLQGAR